jgi:chromosome segregation ATPase
MTMDSGDPDVLRKQLEDAQSQIAALTGARDEAHKTLETLKGEHDILSKANTDLASQLQESGKALAGFEDVRKAHDALKEEHSTIAAQLEEERKARSETENRMLDFRRSNILERYTLSEDVAVKVKTMTEDQIATLEGALPGIVSAKTLESKGLDLSGGGNGNRGETTPYEATRRMIENAKANSR